MIRIAILNAEGKPIAPADIISLTELQQVVEQARNIIRDCERLAYDRNPKTATPKSPTPYMT
jgi:hypothetical protein